MTKPISRIVVRRAPGKIQSRGILTFEGRSHSCLLGKNGISTNKREGDWKTPAGDFRLCFALCRRDRLMLQKGFLPLRTISPSDGWCDEPWNANYNRLVKLPFTASHEEMFRSDGLYDVVVVMDHNYSRRIRGRGSAVFFHLTAQKEWTAGCVAISPEVMRRIFPRLSERTVMQILP